MYSEFLLSINYIQGSFHMFRLLQLILNLDRLQLILYQFMIVVFKKRTSWGSSVSSKSTIIKDENVYSGLAII